MLLLSLTISASYMYTVLNTELWEWRAARTACPAFVGQSCLLVTLPAAAQHNNNSTSSSSSSSISSSSTTCSQEEAQLEQDVGTQIDATAADDDDESVVVAATESKEAHMLAFFGGQVSYIPTKPTLPNMLCCCNLPCNLASCYVVEASHAQYASALA
jgi:hypothetical protein